MSHQAKNKVLTGLQFLLETLGENLCPCLFHYERQKNVPFSKKKKNGKGKKRKEKEKKLIS